jgi:putative RecB family exonuclease
VLRIPAETESIEGFVGKRVHEVLERLYRVARKGQVPSLKRVLQRFGLLWDEHYDPERVRIARPDAPLDFYRDNGERCLANYYRRHYPFDADETLGLEQRVTFALDESNAYRFQGVIDRIVRARDGAIEIHDYKTAQRVPRQQLLDRDRQLGLYQIGVTGEYGNDQPIRLVWHYLLLDQLRTSSRTSAQLEELRESTIGLIDRIRAETEFAPSPGPLCRWCEHRDRCPANPERLSDARPSEEPDTPSSPAPPHRQLEFL